MNQTKKVLILVATASMMIAFQNCGQGFQALGAGDSSLGAISLNNDGMKQVGAKMSSVSHSFNSGGLNFSQIIPSGAAWVLIQWTCSSDSRSVSVGAEILDSTGAVIINEASCQIASSSTLETISGSALMPIPANGKTLEFVSGYQASGNNFPTITATFYQPDISNLPLIGSPLGNFSYDSSTATTPPTPITIPTGTAWLFVQSTCSSATMTLSFADVGANDLMDYVLCSPGATTVGVGAVMIPVPVGATSISMSNVVATGAGISETTILPSSQFISGAGIAASIPTARASSYSYLIPTNGTADYLLSIPSGATWIDGWMACENNEASPTQSVTATFVDISGNSLLSFEACNFATASSFGAAYAPFQIPIPTGAAKIDFNTGDPTGTQIKATLSGYFWTSN